MLPVLFQHLPLREDFAETKSIFNCFHFLYENYYSDIEVYLPKTIELAAASIDDPRVTAGNNV